MIMSDDPDVAKMVNRKVFPGSQGGPLMHIIAAKAVAFGEALKPEFKTWAGNVVANADALAKALVGHGYRLCTGGTDNHLLLVDLQPRDADLTGADAEQWLEAAGIITNKNGIPNDPRPPMVTSGLRLGTAALTTRGFTADDMVTVAGLIDRVLAASGEAAVCDAVRNDVHALCDRYPLFH
jgi:glycine hydroxymethyltransferase